MFLINNVRAWLKKKKKNRVGVLRSRQLVPENCRDNLLYDYRLLYGYYYDYFYYYWNGYCYGTARSLSKNTAVAVRCTTGFEFNFLFNKLYRAIHHSASPAPFAFYFYAVFPILYLI